VVLLQTIFVPVVNVRRHMLLLILFRVTKWSCMWHKATGKVFLKNAGCITRRLQANGYWLTVAERHSCWPYQQIPVKVITLGRRTCRVCLSHRSLPCCHHIWEKALQILISSIILQPDLNASATEYKQKWRPRTMIITRTLRWCIQ